MARKPDKKEVAGDAPTSFIWPRKGHQQNGEFSFPCSLKQRLFLSELENTPPLMEGLASSDAFTSVSISLEGDLLDYDSWDYNFGKLTLLQSFVILHEGEIKYALKTGKSSAILLASHDKPFVVPVKVRLGRTNPVFPMCQAISIHDDFAFSLRNQSFRRLSFVLQDAESRSVIGRYSTYGEAEAIGDLDGQAHKKALDTVRALEIYLEVMDDSKEGSGVSRFLVSRYRRLNSTTWGWRDPKGLVVDAHLRKLIEDQVR